MLSLGKYGLNMLLRPAPSLRPLLMLGGAAAALLCLAGCSQPQQNAATPSTDATAAPLALPLTTGQVAAATAAPATDALPPAPPPPRRRLSRPADAYGYVDQAYAMSSAIGSAPPDYTFDYAGTRPWVWRTETNAIRVEEQTPDGNRDYYYEPGAADPYLVRDGSYAYAFADGGLVAVYDSRGRPLSQEDADRRADRAGRAYARGRDLRASALERQRESVNAAMWAARRADSDAQRRRWQDAQQQSADWRAWHADHSAEQQAYWRDEAARRQQSATAFDHWSADGYHGAPPPPPQTAGSSAVTAGLVGALIGVVAGRQQGHDDPGHPQDDPAARQRVMDQVRQEELQAQSARQAQAAAIDASLAQARRQQAEADAAHRADAVAQAQAQVQALEAQRRQQAQADALRSQQLTLAAQNSALLARQAQAEAQARNRAQAEATRQAQLRQQQADADAASRARLQAQSAQIAAQRAAIQAEQAAALARQAQARAQVQAQIQSTTHAAPAAPAVPPTTVRPAVATSPAPVANPAGAPPPIGAGGAPRPHHGSGDGDRHRPDGTQGPGRPQP